MQVKPSMRWVTLRQRRLITGERSLRRGSSSVENRATAVVMDITENSTEQRENRVPRTTSSAASARNCIISKNSAARHSLDCRRRTDNVDNDKELLALKNGDNVRVYCNLDINGKSVNFMLDCGATCNVLPRADAIVVNRKSTDLKPPTSRL